jgi:FkbM family methyltransferase
MKYAKRLFKQSVHNRFFRGLAGFGRALNRLYENRNYDIHSNGELTVIRKISALKPAVILDGGANIGKYSQTLRRYIPDARIFAFEPVNSTFSELQLNLRDMVNIIPVNKGLYSENCLKEINVFASSTHSSIYDAGEAGHSISGKQQIQLIRGDDFVKENAIEKIDFLKLDLEGAEYDDLIGFSKCLAEKRIRVVQFEYGTINITTKKLLIDFYALFGEYGYAVGKIFPKTVEFRPYAHKYEDFLGPNFLAVDKDDADLIGLFGRKRA